MTRTEYERALLNTRIETEVQAQRAAEAEFIKQLLYPGIDGDQAYAVGPWDAFNPTRSGVVTMLDDRLMTVSDRIEYIMSRKPGAAWKISNWTSRNNYAIPGTEHAAAQRKMAAQLQEHGYEAQVVERHVWEYIWDMDEIVKKFGY
jgi:hypothetical protein